ncbi:MAG: bactofilin family protein [Anaerolineae bacterium]
MFKKIVFDPTRLIDTMIAENASVNGELKCDGNMRIEGLVEGSVDCTGHVIIGPKATVRAEVHARNVSVQGTVEGNIYGDRVEILSSGRVLGDVNVIDLLLDEGGLVRGHVIMRKDELPAPQPLPVAAFSVDERPNEPGSS